MATVPISGAEVMLGLSNSVQQYVTVVFKGLDSSVSTGKIRESGSIPVKLKGRFLFQSTSTISEGHPAAHSTFLPHGKWVGHEEEVTLSCQGSEFMLHFLGLCRRGILSKN
jgi:hypothetical protein